MKRGLVLNESIVGGSRVVNPRAREGLGGVDGSKERTCLAALSGSWSEYWWSLAVVRAGSQITNDMRISRNSRDISSIEREQDKTRDSSRINKGGHPFVGHECQM